MGSRGVRGPQRPDRPAGKRITGGPRVSQSEAFIHSASLGWPDWACVIHVPCGRQMG